MNQLSIITQDIQGCKSSFNAMAGKNSVNFEREAEFAIQVISGNTYLLKVAMNNRQSVIDAVNNIGAIGISLNPAKKQAYLIPRKNKVCLEISYMGLIDLAVTGNAILWAQAVLVRANDDYIPNGLDKAPTHKFNTFSTDADRGPIVGAYAVAKVANGDFLTTSMTIGEVFDIRDRSEAYKAFQEKKTSSCPWTTDPGEMIKKTVIKRSYKTWPREKNLGAAIHYLDNEGGEGILFEAPNSSELVTMMNEIKLTTTDAEALAYWKANNARLVHLPQDHATFKSVVLAHRSAMHSTEQGQEQAQEQVQVAVPIPDSLRQMVNDMTSAGLKYCLEYFNGCSKATQDKLTPHMAKIKQMASTPKLGAAS